MSHNLVEELFELEKEHHDHDWCPKLDRRAAVRLFGMSAVAAVAGCSAVSNAAAGTATISASGTTASTTALSASATTTAQNATLTLTATVAPAAATGSVTFYNGSTVLGTATVSAGKATLTTSFSATGTVSMTAVYGGSATYAASTSSAVSVTVTASSTACGAMLEGEEGPYFVDDSASGYFRSNILSNLDGTQTQTGVPLALTLYVFDSKSNCAAMQSVQVDIWHCNAAGLYSAESVESTVGQTWLRGYQLTDATGKVAFQTIVPGWYAGRTTHIHLRLRSTYDSKSTGGTDTVQLFFDQTLVDTLATSVAPYKSEGKNSTTNASDHVYTGEENGTTLMSLTGSATAGYAATFNVYLPIAS